MAHFVEQYTDAIRRCEDYDLLACEIDRCISKNILNFVSTDIKEAIDRLGLNSPFYKFMKTMVWAASVSDHTETSLNLLRYFCNKIVKEFDSLTIELDEFSLKIVTICADDKQFLNKVSDDRKIELYNTLAQWFLFRTHQDRKDEELQHDILLSMNLILQGKTMQELDWEFQKWYKNIDTKSVSGNKYNHQVNEIIRPFQALFMNIIQNVDQISLLKEISVTTWRDHIEEKISSKARMYENKFKIKNSYDSYYLFLNDNIWNCKSLNDELSKTGFENIENPIVGRFIWRFLEILHYAYSEYNFSIDEIRLLTQDAKQILYDSFAVIDKARLVINDVITSYCNSGEYEDCLLKGKYFEAVKSYLNQDEMFNLWVADSSFNDQNKLALHERVYATYIHSYMNPIIDSADKLLKFQSEELPPNHENEDALRFIKGLGDILNDNYDSSEEGEEKTIAAIEAAGYSDTNKYPIFILLTLDHSVLSKMITGMTGDDWSHACLAFDISLDPLYSFGTKKIDKKGRELGFVIMNPTSDVWGTVPVSYELYVTYVDKISLEKMKMRMNYFIKNADRLKYDFIGLAGIFFNLKSKTEAKWFCSRFVAEIINSGKCLSKDPSLYRPQQLKEIDNVELVIADKSIQDYNVSAAAKALNMVKNRPEGLCPVLEAKSEQIKDKEEDRISEEDEEETEYDGPEIEAKQSTKGYKKGSKLQADSERKIYSAYKTYKNNEAKVDSQLSKMLGAAKRAFSQDKTEEIIEGKRFTPIGLLKKILVTSAIFSYSKVAGFVYLLVSHTLSKKRTTKQKKEILLQIETEIKMLDEKIEDARGDGNRKAKYALMRTKQELIRARDKIKYNLTATPEDMKTAKAYINNDSRDNL